MLVDNYIVRPTMGHFAIYRTYGENMAKVVYEGTQEACRKGVKNIRLLYRLLTNYITTTGCLKNGKAEYLVWLKNSLTGHYYESCLKYDVDEECFIDLIVSDMFEEGGCSIVEAMNIKILGIRYKHGIKEDVHGRYDFIPEEGKTYTNAGGGDYKCLANVERGSILQSIVSKWTFIAHDIVIDEKDEIEWSHSTDGRYEKDGISSLQIYEEVKMNNLIEDLEKHIDEFVEGYREDQTKYMNYRDSAWVDQEAYVRFENYDFKLQDKKLFILNNITDSEKRQIAELFDSNHDCNVPDNDQWEGLIDEFLYRKLTEGGAA